MKARVHFTVAEAETAGVHGAVVVVIDVVRATTTIVEALANGARAVYPLASSEEAIRLAHSLGREDTLLCGERKGLKVEGFDLGNSPREFTPSCVADKRLVMSTTNGTVAFHAAQALGASRIVAASFLNLTAAARSVAGAESLTVLCAGRGGLFSLDDAVCAGLLLREAEAGAGQPAEKDDAATAAVTLAASHTPDVDFLRRTAAGRALERIGMEGDLEVCADVDRHSLVPEMHDRTIRVPGGPPGRR